MRKNLVILGGLALLLLVAAHPAQAQSTLFNIPSTDVVGTSGAYAEFDYFAQIPGSSPRSYAYVPRVVVGLGGNVEAGVNVAAFKSYGTQWYLQPNVKWKFAANDEKGVAASVGTILYTPMNNRSSFGDKFYGLAYANVSKKVSGDYGPRFTIGPYGLYSIDKSAGTRGGVIAAYEQPIAPKVQFVADWFSGSNGFGYVTPGFSFTLPGNGLFNAGYSIGNSGYHNRSLFLYYGVSF